MIKLSIVILSYNTKDLTLACLRSIASAYKKELEEKQVEIIVVDNNSSDGSVESLKHDGAIELIQNKENFGFGKGCNIGAKASKGKYTLFLNSDTQVLDKGFIKMTEFLESNPKVAILGGKIENNDGSPQNSAGKFYNLFNLFLMLLGMERLGLLRSSPDKIQRVDWVSGACFMVRSDIFKKISGFDEKIFMYMEDMEVCYRTQKFGYEIYFYPKLKLLHGSQGSSNRTFAIINIYKGILYFYSKHKTYLEYLIAKTLLIVKAGALIAVGFLTFNPGLSDRYKKAVSNL